MLKMKHTVGGTDIKDPKIIRCRCYQCLAKNPAGIVHVLDSLESSDNNPTRRKDCRHFDSYPYRRSVYCRKRP